MIPKIIHYVWLGNNKIPPLGRKCIDSWKRFCPDYKIICWNESNYDFTKNKYMKQALEAKKWGFVPDYARLDIIYQYGGIYLDTDVEIIKRLDPLLENEGFAGFESEDYVALGLGFGAGPNLEIIKELRDDYDSYDFINSEGEMNLLPSPKIQSAFLRKKGLLPCTGNSQTIDGLTIYPQDYFNPLNRITKKCDITSNTYTIHRYMASWWTPQQRLKYKVINALNKINPSIVKEIVQIKSKIKSQ